MQVQILSSRGVEVLKELFGGGDGEVVGLAVDLDANRVVVGGVGVEDVVHSVDFGYLVLKRTSYRFNQNPSLSDVLAL